MKFENINLLVSKKANAEAYKQGINDLEEEIKEIQQKITFSMLKEEEDLLKQEEAKKKNEVDNLKSNYKEKRQNVEKEIENLKKEITEELEEKEKRFIKKEEFDNLRETKEKKEEELVECEKDISEVKEELKSLLDKDGGYQQDTVSLSKKLDNLTAYKTYINEEIKEVNDKLKDAIVIEDNIEEMKEANYLRGRLSNLTYDGIEEFAKIELKDNKKEKANNEEELEEPQVSNEIDEEKDNENNEKSKKVEKQYTNINTPSERVESSNNGSNVKSSNNINRRRTNKVPNVYELTQEQKDELTSEGIEPGDNEYNQYLKEHGINSSEKENPVNKIQWNSKLTQEQIDELISEGIEPGDNEYNMYLWNHGIKPDLEKKEKETELSETPDVSDLNEDEKNDNKENSISEDESENRDIHSGRKSEVSKVKISPITNTIDYEVMNKKGAMGYLTKDLNYTKEYIESDEIKDIIEKCQEGLGEQYDLSRITKELDPNILSVLNEIGNKDQLNEYVKSIYDLEEVPFELEYDLRDMYKSDMLYNKEKSKINKMVRRVELLNRVDIKQDGILKRAFGKVKSLIDKHTRKRLVEDNKTYGKTYTEYNEKASYQKEENEPEIKNSILSTVKTKAVNIGENAKQHFTSKKISRENIKSGINNLGKGAIRDLKIFGNKAIGKIKGKDENVTEFENVQIRNGISLSELKKEQKVYVTRDSDNNKDNNALTMEELKSMKKEKNEKENGANEKYAKLVQEVIDENKQSFKDSLKVEGQEEKRKAAMENFKNNFNEQNKSQDKDSKVK